MYNNRATAINIFEPGQDGNIAALRLLVNCAVVLFQKNMMQSDEFYMKKAYLEAKKAFKRGEVPVGAVIVDENGEILATGYNKKEEKNDPSLHAEVVAIRKACAKRNNWR